MYHHYNITFSKFISSNLSSARLCPKCKSLRLHFISFQYSHFAYSGIISKLLCFFLHLCRCLISSRWKEMANTIPCGIPSKVSSNMIQCFLLLLCWCLISLRSKEPANTIPCGTLSKISSNMIQFWYYLNFLLGKYSLIHLPILPLMLHLSQVKFYDLPCQKPLQNQENLYPVSVFTSNFCTCNYNEIKISFAYFFLIWIQIGL